MSASAKAYIDDLRIPIPGRRRFLRYCADTMNWRTGDLRFRIDTCSRVTGLSKRAILYHSRWAQDAGVLTAQRRTRGRCNIYTLHIGQVPRVPVDAPCIPDPVAADCTSDRPDCTSEPGPVAPQIAPHEPLERTQERGTQGEKEDARGRARATPPDEILVAGEEDRRIEEVPPDPPEAQPPARVPFPDEDPELRPEEETEIRAAGHDPAELRDEVRDWAHREGATSSYWPHVMVKWARKTPPRRRRPAVDRGPRRETPPGPAKQDRFLRTLAAFAAVRQRQEARS